jgi:hypothetical protein
MALWFYRGLRQGIQTTRYPRGALDPWTRGLPSAPAFHSRRLTPALADRLADGCPARAIVRQDRELVVDLGRCTGCGRCLHLAGADPAGEAVVPSGEFLLATGDRAALVKRVAIAGDDAEAIR